MIDRSSKGIVKLFLSLLRSSLHATSNNTLSILFCLSSFPLSVSVPCVIDYCFLLSSFIPRSVCLCSCRCLWVSLFPFFLSRFHSFIHYFIHSLNQFPFIHSFVHSFIHLFTHVFILLSFFAFCRLYVRCFVGSSPFFVPVFCVPA